MKTYTAYSVVRGVLVTLAFFAFGLPILIFASAFVLVTRLGVSFFAERSFEDFWDSFSQGLNDYWQEVKGLLGDFGIMSFHA